MLCRNYNVKFIRIRLSFIHNRRFRTESRYIGSFAERHYLEIVMVNEGMAFSRASCLNLNAEIVRIAMARERYVLYVKIELCLALYAIAYYIAWKALYSSRLCT